MKFGFTFLLILSGLLSSAQEKKKCLYKLIFCDWEWLACKTCDHRDTIACFDLEMNYVKDSVILLNGCDILVFENSRSNLQEQHMVSFDSAKFTLVKLKSGRNLKIVSYRIQGAFLHFGNGCPRILASGNGSVLNKQSSSNLNLMLPGDHFSIYIKYRVGLFRKTHEIRTFNRRY